MVATDAAEGCRMWGITSLVGVTSQPPCTRIYCLGCPFMNTMLIFKENPKMDPSIMSNCRGSGPKVSWTCASASTTNVSFVQPAACNRHRFRWIRMEVLAVFFVTKCLRKLYESPTRVYTYSTTVLRKVCGNSTKALWKPQHRIGVYCGNPFALKTWYTWIYIYILYIDKYTKIDTYT